MWAAPKIPITRKNTAMMGPKKAATRAVPRLCAQKSDIRIRIVTGRI